MPAKIFVGNIASGSKDADLQALFEAFGEVTECDIVSNYAFVHMANEAEAKAAIAALHQSTFNGVQIRCELSTKNTQGRKRAREAEDHDDLGRGRGGRGARGARAGRGAGRGGATGRGVDRFASYNDVTDRRPIPPLDRTDPYASRADPFRDPYIRELLLRDPYVRDLIDRELSYRDSLTRNYDTYGTRDPYTATRDRDPYTRPPPDYYWRGTTTTTPVSGVMPTTGIIGKTDNGTADFTSDNLGYNMNPQIF